MTDAVEITNGVVTPAQIIKAIISNARKICDTYGFELVVDDTSMRRLQLTVIGQERFMK